MPIDNNEDKLIELIRLAIDQSSEHSHIEFKDGRGGGVPSKVWNAVSAFSNTPGGGYIVFGVAEQDDRTYKVVGGLNLSELQEKIVSTFSEKIRNAGNYKLITLRYEDNDLLVLRINEASDEHKPCYHEDFGLPRGAYVRLGNVNRRITEEEMRSFLRFSPQYKFDKIATGIGKDVLSNSKVESYLKKSAEKTGRDYTGISDKVLKNLGILTESDSGLSVSLAGLLIFSSDNPQKYEISRRYVVRCVRYSGKDVASDIIDKADIEGTLDDLIDQTLKFVLRNIPLRAEIVGAKRVETYGYPEKAIREIIANAVIHRDYQISETYVQVAVFSDRVEVSNPGTLPPGITVENLKESQFSRNKVVARIMNIWKSLEEELI